MIFLAERRVCMQFRWLSTFQEWHMLRLLTKPFGRIACKFSRLSIYVWKKSFKNGVGSINFICDLKRLFFSSTIVGFTISFEFNQFLPMSDSDEDMIGSEEVSFVVCTMKIALRPCFILYLTWRRKHRVGVHTFTRNK